ncbi:RE1, partial [Symbiodinium necroappetens]
CSASYVGVDLTPLLAYTKEVIMEEVRKQVKAALDERESEMKKLQNENLELKQVLTGMTGLLLYFLHNLLYLELNPSAARLEGHLQALNMFFNKGQKTEAVVIGIHHEGDGGPGAGATTGEDNAMVDHLHLLVQGMRQLQQLQMNRKDPAEAEAVKGSVELQRMPEPGDAAVEFNDWMYITEQQLGALTDNASSWFAKCLACAREAYMRYQGASALERLSVAPMLTEELKDAKWFRLERRVLSLLLAAMPKAVREDTITHRVESVAGVLYRLHVLYQPGGAMERTAILKHLEGAPGSDDPGEVVTQLRRWRRYLARAEEMSVALPDASLQLHGIEKIIARVLEKFADVKFRLALARNELRLSSAPTSETVLKYYQHALAELQQVTPSVKTNQDGARLKGASTTTAATPGTGGSGSPTASPKKGKNPCKFFQSEAGCKRGNNCGYAHEFLSKADRKTRCWTCGAVGHRQQSCPTTTGDGGKGSGRQQGQSTSNPTTSATSSTPTAAKVQASTVEASSSENSAPSNSTTITSTTTSVPQKDDEAAAHREEMKKLLKEASSMLSKIQLMTMRVDDTNKATEDLELLLRSAGMDQHGLALLDSGASHPFRNPVDTSEFDQAKSVGVELADGQMVELRQTTTGTLLKEKGSNPQSPIVPLGSLVQQLGCSISWSRKSGLQVVHPSHGDLKIKMKGSCPYISEMEALRLIAEIEDKSLERLQQATVRSLWTSSSTTMAVPWGVSLDAFVNTGKRTSALMAMMDPSFPLALETSSEKFGFVGPSDLDLSDESGLSYLKSLPVNRRTRRRLHGSRWIVHLYDGKNQAAAEELRKLENEDVMVLEIDIQRSKAYNMKGWSNVMRALLWAACRGQLEGVLGSPPRQNGDELRQKLMYLWMVAERGSVVNNVKKPFLFMEYPGEMVWWKTPEWSDFRDEYHLTRVCLDAGQDQTFQGVTNMNFMNYLKESRTTKEKAPTAWNIQLLKGISEGVDEWRRWPDQVRQAHLLCKMDGRLEDMSEKELKQWAKHVRDGHVPFNKRCRTCVMNAGIDADGKYRYALVGDDGECDLAQEHLDDGGGVGLVEYDDDFLVEEETVEALPSREDQVDLDQKNEDYRKFYEEVYKEVGDSLEYQTLLYVMPLRSRQKIDVNAAMRRMYLQLRQEGHPVTRVHSDRARELKSATLRQWLYEKDVWVTTGESQTPQQNGRAEAAVKNLKKHAKVLLASSSLPRECWPLAMTFAAHQQRKRATGQSTARDPTFGARVAVKSKVFGTGGSYDLDPRWREGCFVGYSSDVRNGLVVRCEDGTFVTSCHVREGLVDAEAIVGEEQLEADLPLPTRRLRAKARLAFIINPYEDVEFRAKELEDNKMYEAKDVLSLWEDLKRIPHPKRRGAKQMFVEGDGCSFYSGCYVHGGVCGIMKTAKHLPNVTSYLVKAAKEITRKSSFGCVAIVENVGMGPHRDSHNQHGTENTVTALTSFEDGQVWVEKSEEVYMNYNPEKQFPFHLDNGIKPSPGADDEEELHNLGFELPSRDVRPVDAKEEAENQTSMFEPPQESNEATWFSGLSKLNEDQRDLLEELQERSTTLRRLLEEEEILVEEYRRMGKQVTEEAQHTHQLLVDMMEQTTDELNRAENEEVDLCLKGAQCEPDESGEIDDVENHLNNLQGELQVVINVPLDQVKRNLPAWVPAIDKELGVLFKNGEGGTLRKISLKEAKRRERAGELTIVPSKLVFTCKPPNQGAAPKSHGDTKSKEPKAKWRRKCRLVLCGNFAERPEGQSQAELYAAGASADSMRVALVLASVCYWAGAGSDINGAFLLAPWPKHMRRYAILPPKTLVLAERATDLEAWEVDRALYGLRESPAVWSDFRRQRLRSARVAWKQGHLVLKATVVDPEVWMILYSVEGAPDVLAGVLVTYVDDLLYLAENQVIITLHSWLCEEWPSSPLEWTTDGTKYLGVEIVQSEGHFLISQRGYLESLVRSYDLEPGEHVRLPCPREWLVDEGDATVDQEDFTPDELKRAQKITGELLWVTRARPDILFVVTMMASALARRPCHVYRVGLKVMAYLAASVDVQLLEGFSDASFAPFGGRSYGASAITLNEAELYEAAQTTLLMKGVHALIKEIVGKAVPQALYIDNSASVSLIGGCQGSWRTRHLKVRCAFITDMVQQGELAVSHISGQLQLADLPTKLHGKVRLAELMNLWGFVGGPLARINDKTRVAVLMCLMVALLATPTEAAVPTQEIEKKAVQLAGFDELTVVTVLVCIAAVAMWELGKRLGCWLLGIKEETAKERRLRRLRDLARTAAQEELDREYLKREIEVETEAWKRPLKAASSDPVSLPGPSVRSTATQTPQMSEPEPRVQTRIIYRDAPVPQDVPVSQFWKTNDHRSRVHTRRDCHGLRNSGVVFMTEYCHYCEGRTPLFTRQG